MHNNIHATPFELRESNNESPRPDSPLIMLRLYSFLCIFSLLLNLASAQPGGFDFGEAKFCPPFRCPKKTQVPVPKWPLALESMGCTSMGGGMQLMTPGSSETELHETCCDLRQACLQICGSMKAYCDDEFTKCTTAACETIVDDDDAKQKCTQSSNLHGIMIKLDQCQKYDQYQSTHCDCVEKDAVTEARERVLRAFYKKYNPENVEKAASLAIKADTPTKFVGLLLKLVKKYHPDTIRKVKDPQQEYMEKIMKQAREEKKQNNDGDEGDEQPESDAEDLGVDEL